MTDFPSIQKSDWRLYRSKPVKRQILTPDEAGYRQSRAAATQMKREFTIGWPSMLRTDYDLLVTFFVTYQGSTFNFINPVTDAVHVVGFMDDELPEEEAIGTDYVRLEGLRLWER